MQPTARLAAAGFILAGGFIHLELWVDGYRRIPGIGPLFLLNVVASALVALALVVGKARGQVLVVAAALTVSSAAALLISRTVGLLGFTEGWTPAAIQAMAAEAGAIVAIAAVVSAARARPAYVLVQPPSRRPQQSNQPD
ncbi:MAG: hypothetical protein KY458_05250 [Actinobacteria bacterium]|nr:hypothetical protein [Actinomycetota bacterium]